ncbi:MAG: nucleoside hydrolase [Oscillospiraceae bacterium]|nr:nucleoside hydrolase [Oscillospiraceae bacterium]
MSEQKIPVIFDCDPGVDDAVALMVAFAQPKLDILAVTTVAGNVSIEMTTRNARTMLSVLGVTSRVYQGASGPLLTTLQTRFSTAHGDTGLGTYTMPDADLHPLEPESALEAQSRILREATEPVTIIAVGPLTNIAILLKAYPELKEKIAQISIMGGGFHTGNASAAAEFNIWFDPEAAEIVFDSGVPILLAGLDVTAQATMSGRHLLDLRGVGNATSVMLADALEVYFGGMPSMDVADSPDTLHDVVSVLALTDPDLFSGRDLLVRVETGGNYCRGYTVADFRSPHERRSHLVPNCHVLLELDLDRFHEKILAAAKRF